MQFQCGMFVASWTGVVRYHGPRPVNRPNHVWVSNHTSMIDYIILTAYSPFAVIMQLHGGWIAFLQTRVLSCLGCLWFNRNEVSPRSSACRGSKCNCTWSEQVDCHSSCHTSMLRHVPTHTLTA